MSSVDHLPPGMMFEPTDVEILTYYLPLLIAGHGDVKTVLGEFSDLIQISNVYSYKPSFYFPDDESHDALGRGNQRFVFSPREQIAQAKSDGKRPKRGVTVRGSGTEGGVGFWKSSTGDKPVLDEHGGVIGFSNMLNYYEYNGNNNNGKRSRKDTKKTRWLMYEYRLGGGEFQKYVICKIKDTLRPKTDRCDLDWPQMEPQSDGLMSLIEGGGSDKTMGVDENKFWLTEEDMAKFM